MAPHFLLEPFEFSGDLLWLNSSASSLHVPLLSSQPYFSSTLSQPPIFKLLASNAVSSAWIILFSHLHLPILQITDAAGLSYGPPPSIPWPPDLSAILTLITQGRNHQLAHLSAPLDFKLLERRVMSALFTALSPAPGTAPNTKKCKQGEKKKLGSPGRHATKVSGRTTRYPSSLQISNWWCWWVQSLSCLEKYLGYYM